MTYLRSKNGTFKKGTEQPYGFDKGHIPWNKGIPRSEETKRKISKSHYGKGRLEIDLRPSSSLSYIIGVLLGDGEVRNGGIRLQQTQLMFAKEFMKHVKIIGMNPRFANAPSIIKKGQTRVIASSENFVEWFKLLTTREIQKYVKDYPFWFLKGFYESDGTLTQSNIEFRNRNIHVLYLVRNILGQNNFETSWGEYSTPAGKPYYCIRVLGGREKMKTLLRLMNPCIKRWYKSW